MLQVAFDVSPVEKTGRSSDMSFDDDDLGQFTTHMEASDSILDFSSLEKGASWSRSYLRAYLAHVKLRFQPTVGPAAKILLTRYYQLQRQSSDRTKSRTTVRLLESLLRLSEAHAKLMCRDTVTVDDAIMAITLLGLSQTEELMLDGTDTALHSPFPTHEDATQVYAEQEAKIFATLHCSRESLEAEASDTAKLRVNDTTKENDEENKRLLHSSDDHHWNASEMSGVSQPVGGIAKRPRLDVPGKAQGLLSSATHHVPTSATGFGSTGNLHVLPSRMQEVLRQAPLQRQSITTKPVPPRNTIDDVFSLADEEW